MKFGPKSIKREQKTSLFMREVSSLIQRLSLDEPALSKIFVTGVKLSADYNICYVYFSTFGSKKDFDDAFGILKLYRPSMRKALAENIASRYTPELIFLYDETKEKERKIQDLLDKVKEEDKKVLDSQDPENKK